ncbi:MAG TPA: sulfotransferase [Rhizomicrobium sp.]|jgi:Flp pilus assembly protein TadD
MAEEPDRLTPLHTAPRERPDLRTALEQAETLLAKGDWVGCEPFARTALAIAPRNPHAHRVMGLVFLGTMRAASAEYHFRRIIEFAGERPRAVVLLAGALKQQGRLDEAEEWFAKAATLDPSNAGIWIDWCRLAEARGDFSRAWNLLDEAHRAEGETTRIRMTRAVLFGREGKHAEAERELTTATEMPEGPKPAALLERGRHREALKRYNEAWADFSEAKRGYRKEGFVYDEAAAHAAVQSLKQVFPRERMAMLPRANKRADVPQPLFILGFPRSGTSLLEQMLAAHPAIRAGDELPFLQLTANLTSRWIGSRFGYPSCLAELSAGDQLSLPNHLRDCYLGWAEQWDLLGGTHRFFTDKMPLNEMHLGLLHLIFPHSPLIFIRRHPLDIVCSNFRKYITYGFNQAFAIESSAQHYLLMDGLLAHYREQLDLNLLEIRYENLVADPEAEARRVFDFVGLEFDARCLVIGGNSHVSRTPSYAQVAQGLSNNFVCHYRHYRKHLNVAAEILRPVLDRLGYSAD